MSTVETDPGRTAPPVVLSPRTAVAAQAGTYAIEGTSTSASLIQVWADANGNGRRDAGEALVGSQQLNGSGRDWQVRVNLAIDSVNVFVVTATDDATRPARLSRGAPVPAISHGRSALPIVQLRGFPWRPTVVSPSAALAVNADTFVVSGRVQVGSLVRVWVDANRNGRRDAGEPLAGSQQVGLPGGEFSVVVPLAQDAANHLLVTGTLKVVFLELESDAAAAPVITEDSTPPAVTNVADGPDPFSPNGDGVLDAVTVSYRLSEPASVRLGFDDATGTNVRTIIGDRGSGPQGEVWDGRGPAGAVVGDGSVTYRVDATDRAGNPSSPEAGAVTVDTAAPSAAVTVPGADSVTNDRHLIADASDASGIDRVQFQLSADGGTTWSDLGSPTSSPDLSVAAGVCG